MHLQQMQQITSITASPIPTKIPMALALSITHFPGGGVYGGHLTGAVVISLETDISVDKNIIIFHYRFNFLFLQNGPYYIYFVSDQLLLQID